MLFSILVIFDFSGCNRFASVQCKIDEDDITEFYKSNTVLIENAVKEYIINTDGKDISIFFKDGLKDVDDFGLDGITMQDSVVAIWEPETKTNYLNHIEDYEQCLKVLFLMNDYMLEHGFVQKNNDYSVSISKYYLGESDNPSIHSEKYELNDPATPYAILFQFSDFTTDDDYRLFYSETELIYEKINENWYIYQWGRV